MNLKTSWRLTQATVQAWYDDNALAMGAGLAYYAVFSVPPLMIIALAVMGSISNDNSLNYVHNQLEPLIGATAANAIAVMLTSVRSSRHNGAATFVSSLLLFVGASAMFAHLQNSMNKIWEVPPRPGSLVKNFLKQRLLAFAMVLTVSLLLVVSLVWSAVLSIIGGYFKPATSVVLDIIDIIVSCGAVVVLIAGMYKLIPDVWIDWQDVWAGATVTALLYVAGKFAIGFYLSRSGFRSAFGAAGSVLIVLAWIYYLSQILFLGAEFTKAYTKLRKTAGTG